MKQLTVVAPAKINLYLNVAGKRADGYHDIESVMQTVSVYDRLTVTVGEATAETSITVTARGVPVPTDESNLVCRAAAAFVKAVGIDAYRSDFDLEKEIPTEAGLGGGSSDAAAAILALDRLYGTGMSVDALCDIGVKVGADVPFCIRRGTACVRGIGEIMEPIAPMPRCPIVVAMPRGGKVSTGEAYRRVDALGPEADVPFDEFLDVMARGDIAEIAARLYNKFELVTPDETGSVALVHALMQHGALGARMSGSGAAVFGIFADGETAKAAYDALPDDIRKFICEPISA